MKHHPMATANAAAATIGVIYLVCAFSILLTPNLAFTVARSWFHGVTLSEFSNTNFTMVSLVTGLVSSTLGGWLVGYLYAYFYNQFVKK